MHSGTPPDPGADLQLSAALAFGRSPLEALVFLRRPVTRAGLRRAQRLASRLRITGTSLHGPRTQAPPSDGRVWICDTIRLDGHAWAAPNSDTSQLPWLTVLVDTHSRAVVGVVVSDSAPTATTIFKLVHSAAEQRTAPGLRRGPPARLELWSAGVDAPALLTALTHRLPGTAVALPRPNACMHRGLVERVFQHLSRRRGQAGEETL